MCGEFRFRLGRLCPKLIVGCTSSVFDEAPAAAAAAAAAAVVIIIEASPFILVGLFWGTFLPNRPPPAPLRALPSSLDSELAFS